MQKRDFQDTVTVARNFFSYIFILSPFPFSIVLLKLIEQFFFSKTNHNLMLDKVINVRRWRREGVCRPGQTSLLLPHPRNNSSQ